MTELLRPAPIAISEDALDDLRQRLNRARFPEPATVDDWRQGVPLPALRALVEHWRTRYDWRRCEAMLNQWQPTVTTIDGCDIHFFHLRSPHPNALPVILTHGWPGSILEFHKIVGPLVDPVAHGGDAADALHVVLPSLPGYAFSGKPTEPGWNVPRIARAWAELMKRLGYGDRWAAQGGDWGGAVTEAIGQQAPAGCIGVHLNFVVYRPSADEIANADASERDAIARGRHYRSEMAGYFEQQSTRPQTIGYALADSPVGQAAWIYEKFHDWTDNTGTPESTLTLDEMLDNITLYWLTNSGASSARLYWENRHAPRTPVAPVTIPAAITMFPKEITGVSRRWAEQRYQRLVSWREAPCGGHFAAFEQPALFVNELREGLRQLRNAAR